MDPAVPPPAPGRVEFDAGHGPTGHRRIPGALRLGAVTELPRPELQRDVQRLLGRCLLRLQQYEKLLKILLAHHEIAGPAHELPSRLAARIEDLRTDTLGTLVKSLFESYIEIEGAERAMGGDDRASTQAVAIRFRASLQMSEDRREGAKSALKELVILRNDLVHHLVDRFDLWSDKGCAAAIDHLEASYARIDAHFAELQQWARSVGEASALSASFMQSAAFEDLVFNGIAPDGTVDWPSAGIVRVLREASAALGTEGWVRLDDAIGWIGERHAEQTPARYGCKGWPHVLHKARVFQFEYRIDAAGRKVGWYRERR